MRTYILLEVDHRKPIASLGSMIAGRAYTIDGVTNAEVVNPKSLSMEQLQAEGFSLAEISLSSGEVVRT